MSFQSHTKIIKYLYKKKKLDRVGRVMSLDIGRKYIGSAISCPNLKKAIPLKTYEINPQ